MKIKQDKANKTSKGGSLKFLETYFCFNLYRKNVANCIPTRMHGKRKMKQNQTYKSIPFPRRVQRK